MENEAKEQDDIIQDDQVFYEWLVEMVCSSRQLKPSQGLQLYCNRHGMKKFTITNMMLGEKTTRLGYVEASLTDDLQDHRAFDEYLIQSVRSGEMLASHSLFLYCTRHGITELEIVNLKQADEAPRPPVVFFDAIVVNEFGHFLTLVDEDRLAGSL